MFSEPFGVVGRAARDAVRHGIGSPGVLVASATSVVVCCGLVAVTVPLVLLPLIGIPVGLLVRGVVIPAALSGLLTTAVAAMGAGQSTGAERGGLRTLLSGARSHLSQICGAGVTRFAVDVALVGATVTAAYALVVGLAAAGPESGQSLTDTVTYGFGTGVAVVVLGYAVGVVCFQFVDAAVVVGEASTTDAFRESVRLLRTHPGTVLTYTVARLLPGVVALGVVRFVAWPLVQPTVETAAVETGQVAVATTLTLFVVTLAVAFSVVFHLSVYLAVASVPDTAGETALDDSPTH